MQVINKILGVTAEAPGFTKNFLDASDKNQRGFFQVIGYSPTPLVGVKEPSGKWQIDKSIIESEYNLNKGALKNLTIDDLRKNNLSALDNIFFQETGEAISSSIRKDLFNDLSSKHLKSLREASSSLTFRGSAESKKLGKLIDDYTKEFTSKQPEQETTSLLDEKFLSLKDILNLRNQIYSVANSRGGPTLRDAGILNSIYKSLTDDIGTKAEAGDQTEVTNLLKQAHAFSKSLNDTFTRGFPNTILKKQKSGKLDIIPELAINSIFKGGGDAVAYNYSGMESAITFLQKQAGKELDEALTNKLGILKASQEDLLYVMFSEVVNQKTKRVDGDKLARFMSYAKGGYGKVLDRFPDLKNDLKDLQAAQNLYDARKQYYGEVVQGVLKPGNLQATKRLKNVFSFADLLPADTNPGLVIANAIGDPNQRPGNPVNNLKRIIAFGKKAENPDVLEGIKETIFDRAFQFARDEKDIVNFKAFKDYLIKPIVKGQPSVLEIMRSTGVLSSDEALRFSQITNRMITQQRSMPDEATKPIEGPLVSGANAFVDLFARLIGSKVGSALANVIPGRGQGIIESSAGVRTVLGGLNIPTSMTQDLLLQAARDPKFFKLLVTRPKTEKEAVVTAKRVRAYLLNAGLGFVSREIDDDTEEFKKGAPPLPRQFDPDFIPMKQSSVDLPEKGSPTTQTAMAPPSGVNNRLAANVGTAPQAAPNPNQRQQFASLFPNDPISGLINAQQPTRLMAEGGAVPPRQVDIKGQPHMLAYITPQEGGILQLLGGSGAPGPMGIPSFADIGGGPDGASQPGADQSDDPSDNPSYGGDTGYSGSISDAMADTSPTGMSGTGGIGGYGPSSVGSTNIGLDDSIAAMADVMGGLSKGVSGLENMQGSVTYAPVKNVPYDLFGLMKNAMNRHARSSLSKGYQPEFSIDPTTGNITSVTGKGGPGMSIPGIGSLISMIGANMGGITTTGYSGKGVDDRNNNMGGESESGIQTLRPRQEFQEAKKMINPMDIYQADPNRYRLFGR